MFQVGKINRILLDNGTTEKRKYAGGNLKQTILMLRLHPGTSRNFMAMFWEVSSPPTKCKGHTIEMIH